LIGDLHAHIINIPFVLLFAAMLLGNGPLPFAALSYGVLGATNTWDMLLWAPLLLWVMRKKGVLVGIGAVILFAPFYLHFRAPVGGVELFAPRFDYAAILKMFGFFLIGAVPFLFLKKENTFVKFAVAYALFLILLPGFFLVKDIYFKLNPPYASANTYFKVWYQAWIIFAVVVPYCLMRLNKAYVLVCVLLSVGLFHYMFYSVKYLVGDKYVYKGLDGAAYLNVGEKQVIDWINDNVRGQPVLLQAQGESYTTDSLVASYTGLPSLPEPGAIPHASP
jgi:uncharacterized membrane protein